MWWPGKIPDTQTLAYIRRLNLARAMLGAAARSNAPDLSPVEWSQLETQDRQLLGMRDRLSMMVNRYLKQLNYSDTQQTISEKERSSVAACSAQLAGERKELAAGTATKQRFVFKK
jgi:hypothetical protein